MHRYESSRVAVVSMKFYFDNGELRLANGTEKIGLKTYTTNKIQLGILKLEITLIDTMDNSKYNEALLKCLEAEDQANNSRLEITLINRNDANKTEQIYLNSKQFVQIHLQHKEKSVGKERRAVKIDVL